MSGAMVPLIYVLPQSFSIGMAGEAVECTQWKAYGCVMTGLWSGLFIGIITEIFTSNQYGPV